MSTWAQLFYFISPIASATCDFGVFAPPEPDPKAYPPRFVANKIDPAGKVLSGEDMNRRLRREEVAMDHGAHTWKYHGQQDASCSVHG